MTVGDAILNLVDKLLAERKKVVRLELSQQFHQIQDKLTNQD